MPLTVSLFALKKGRACVCVCVCGWSDRGEGGIQGGNFEVVCKLNEY